MFRPSQAEANLRFDDLGNGCILTDEVRIWRLIRTADYKQHQLRPGSDSDRIGLLAFTFEAYGNLRDNQFSRRSDLLEQPARRWPSSSACGMPGSPPGCRSVKRN